MKKIYTLLTIAASWCCTVTETNAQQCTASFTFTVSGMTVQTTNTSTGGVSPNYYWSWGDASSPQNGFNPSHTYTAPGNYTVCLQMFDSTGCQNMFCDNVVISQTSGVHENAGIVGSLSVFPNPAGSETGIVFTLGNSSDVSVNLYDVSGKLVKSGLPVNYPAGRHEVKQDLSDLEAGVYFVEIKAGETYNRTRFVKLH